MPLLRLCAFVALSEQFRFPIIVRGSMDKHYSSILWMQDGVNVGCLRKILCENSLNSHQCSLCACTYSNLSITGGYWQLRFNKGHLHRPCCNKFLRAQQRN